MNNETEKFPEGKLNLFWPPNSPLCMIMAYNQH
jgi:hypothetical protein